MHHEFIIFANSQIPESLLHVGILIKEAGKRFEEQRGTCTLAVHQCLMLEIPKPSKVSGYIQELF